MKPNDLEEALFWRDLAARGPWWWIGVFTLASIVGPVIRDLFRGFFQGLLG